MLNQGWETIKVLHYWSLYWESTGNTCCFPTKWPRNTESVIYHVKKSSDMLMGQDELTKCYRSHFLASLHINPWTPGNAWMRSQHCGYWCPGAKAPGHQYPQCWLNIPCIGPVSYKNIAHKVNSIRKWNHILKKWPSHLRVKWAMMVKKCWSPKENSWSIPIMPVQVILKYQIRMATFLNFELAMAWKHSLRFWPFVQGNQQSLVGSISPHKGPTTQSVYFC